MNLFIVFTLEKECTAEWILNKWVYTGIYNRGTNVLLSEYWISEFTHGFYTK